MKRILLSLAIAFLGTQMAQAATLEVPSQYATVFAAISAAVEGDIINIAEGTYGITATTLNTITDKSLTLNGAGRSLTIIQASATPYTSTSNRSCIVIGAITADRTITIQNMTLQNGGTNSGPGGGGIRVGSGSVAKLTLNVTNVNIINNYILATASGDKCGGGISLSGKIDATLTNCTLSGNRSHANSGGGAIYAAPTSVSLVIDGCNIFNNTAGSKGGGAVLSGTGIVPPLTGGVYATGPLNIKIKNSTLSSNTTTANGGGINIFCAPPSVDTPTTDYSLWVENSTIYGNTTTGSAKAGGGIYFESTTAEQTVTPTQTITINHSTLANNTTNEGTGADGICIGSNSIYPVSFVMNNSIVMNNTGSTSNQSQIGENGAATDMISNGGITNSIFNIIADGTWVTTANNNNLSATVEDLAFAETLTTDATPVLITGASSIARNYVATNALVPALSTDQLGNPRVQNTDAGAWENQIPAVVSHNASLEIKAFSLSVVGNRLIIGNISENATIRVFDIVGKMVANKTSNGNTIEINLNTKGIYTVMVSNGISTKAVKVIY